MVGLEQRLLPLLQTLELERDGDNTRDSGITGVSLRESGASEEAVRTCCKEDARILSLSQAEGIARGTVALALRTLDSARRDSAARSSRIALAMRGLATLLEA